MDAAIVVLLFGGLTLLGALALGAIPALIAQSKGRSFLLWWLYGSVIFIVAVIHAIVLKADDKIVEADALANGGRKCPYCAEVVKMEAKVCRFCHRELPPLDVSQDGTNPKKLAPQSTSEQRLFKRLFGVFVVFIAICCVGYYASLAVASRMHDARVKAAADEDDGPKPATSSSKAAGPTYLPLDTIVANLADVGGEKVISLGVTFEIGAGKSADRVKAFFPTIRNNVIKVVSGYTSTQLASKEGKAKLAMDILEAANASLGSESDSSVQGILFSSFDVQ